MDLKIDPNNIKTEGNRGNKLGQEEVGVFAVVEIMKKAIENLYLAETEVNEFFADLAGMKPAEFAELPLEKTFEILAEFKSLPGFANFFKQAGQLTK